MTLNEWAKKIHENAIKHGWWQTERNFGEIIALCHSELSEALEEYRKGQAPSKIYFNKEENQKPEGIPIELADCIIRILDYCCYAYIDIDEALLLKTEYNKTRGWRHGGKKA